MKWRKNNKPSFLQEGAVTQKTTEKATGPHAAELFWAPLQSAGMHAGGLAAGVCSEL